MPTENHIFMACLDAHLYENEYSFYIFVSIGPLHDNYIHLQQHKINANCLICFRQQLYI
jgi:hypothetical protein